MDGERFDALAKTFAGRLPRRSALRGGLGLAAGLLGIRALSVADAADASTNRFTFVHRFGMVDPPDDLAKSLSGLVTTIQKEKGFLEYSVIPTGDSELTTVGVFISQRNADTAAKGEASWISKHAVKFLAVEPDVSKGADILHADLGAGCPCATGTKDPCGSGRLVCCGESGLLGGAGVCVSADLGCAPPPATPTAAPTTPSCVADSGACPTDCSAGADCVGCCNSYCLDSAVCGSNPGCSAQPGDKCVSNNDCCTGQCSSSGVCFCSDPDRPEVGCPCTTGKDDACGGRPDLCCPSGPGGPGGAGTCISPMADCDAETGCRADAFVCPTTCQAGDSCDTCCSGACLEDGTCGSATHCGASGDSCSADSDCCSGLTCSGGACASSGSCANPGDSCTADSDCCVGQCSPDSVCYCTDPDRPDVGCPCDPSDSNGCGGRPDLCCGDSGSATCISPMATCNP